jgi:DNA replication and repair protein RecF
MTAAIDRSGNREIELDGNAISSSDSNFRRPLLSVFLPDRMSLVTGSPGGRRAHLDNLAVALRITGPDLRGNYSKALIQRNALLAAARGSGSVAPTISAWNKTLARLGSELVAARQQAIDMITLNTTEIADQLGLVGTLEIAHRSGGLDNPIEFESRLESDLQADIDRGYTHFGPHRGDFIFKRDGRDIKEHGSQGEKRLALLSLILAEREVIAESQGAWPVLLLDDVMSELDAKRRELLVKRVSGSGQCLITATEVEHVPCGSDSGVQMISLGPENQSGLRAA